MNSLRDGLKGIVIDKRYRIEDFLGEGGFGAVFRGSHLIFGSKIRDVAIKVIKTEITRGKEVEIFSEAFIQAKASADIPDAATREKLVTIYDFGLISEIDRRGFIVMEYVDGKDLSHIIKQFGGPMPENMCMRYCLPLVEAMSALHSLPVPIIHRDLKPENILLTKDDRIKIADFGLAVRLNQSYKWADGVAGTRVYMSIEALSGMSATQSDVFSIGTIIYQMLTGKFPFDDGTPPNGKEDEESLLWRMNLRKTVVPVRPRSVNNTISGDLSDIVMQCFEPDLKNRFRDAVELLKVLKGEKKSRESCLQSAERAFDRNEFDGTLRDADEGMKLSAAGDKTGFLLKYVKCRALVKLQRFKEAAVLFPAVREECERCKWFMDKSELKKMYESELALHEKMENLPKIRILRKKIEQLK